MPFLERKRGQEPEREKRAERQRRLARDGASCKLEHACRRQRAKRGDHKLHGNTGNSDPDARCREQLDVAKPEPLELSQAEVKLAQYFSSHSITLVAG